MRAENKMPNSIMVDSLEENRAEFLNHNTRGRDSREILSVKSDKTFLWSWYPVGQSEQFVYYRTVSGLFS